MPLVVSYRNSTSNHNWFVSTPVEPKVVSYRNSTSNHNGSRRGHRREQGCILSKFHIKPQPMDDKECLRNRCILSKFHIKPQLIRSCIRRGSSCILSKFHIKPQPCKCSLSVLLCCILSKFHIKPQLLLRLLGRFAVVSYRNSPSNHNVGPHIG